MKKLKQLLKQLHELLEDLAKGVKYAQTHQTMRTYIIIDRLGMRHATIKAYTSIEALSIYGINTKEMFTNLFAIDADDSITFKNNIQLW